MNNTFQYRTRIYSMVYKSYITFHYFHNQFPKYIVMIFNFYNIKHTRYIYISIMCRILFNINRLYYFCVSHRFPSLFLFFYTLSTIYKKYHLCLSDRHHFHKVDIYSCLFLGTKSFLE